MITIDDVIVRVQQRHKQHVMKIALCGSAHAPVEDLSGEKNTKALLEELEFIRYIGPSSPSYRDVLDGVIHFARVRIGDTFDMELLLDDPMSV